MDNGENVNAATQINSGFFVAEKLPDGSPGRPIGNEDGAIMLFEDLALADRVRSGAAPENGPLTIFKVNIVFAGEVLI